MSSTTSSTRPTTTTSTGPGSVTTTPAPARTDAPAAPSTGPARSAGAPGISTAAARRVGLAVLGGGLVWATGMLAVGQNPDTPLGVSLADLSALPLQVSLFGLVALQLRTRATGTTRVAVGMLRFERVLLALATTWTVLHGLFPSFRDDTWLAVLDVFWPLSMLGMAVIGVKIAVTGRWTGPARVWPTVAESWALVVVPIYGALGPVRAADYAGAAHLLIGYCMLGLIIALRPQLTGARD